MPQNNESFLPSPTTASSLHFPSLPPSLLPSLPSYLLFLYVFLAQMPPFYLSTSLGSSLWFCAFESEMVTSQPTTVNELA